jgi:hypothetical protein
MCVWLGRKKERERKVELGQAHVGMEWKEKGAAV